jgi:hypothetical protein
MATYYWVGGAGTWDNSSTTHWALSSGGAGSAGVPTSADNVIFDTLSNATLYTVTVGTTAVCNDVTIGAPLAGNVTFSFSATSVIGFYGSWTNAGTGVTITPTAGCQIQGKATTTGKTVTTNSVSFGALTWSFGTAGGGWTLGSAFSHSGTISCSGGDFSTGNFAVTTGTLQTSGTTTRSISLGSSTVTCAAASPVNIANATGLTFNAGTSTINCSNAAPTFNGGGLTYYNVNFTSNGANVTSAITGGSNTFNNLNQTTPASGRRILSVSTSQTINGTLTLGTTNTYNQRVQLICSNTGVPATLTVATIATLSDVDFRDIIAAGASGTWSGTRLGNALGNSNITFAAGKTVYWNLVAGGNWSANAWATSSGGAVATANFPLAQDTVIIDNTGLTTGNTITMDAGWYIGTLNCTRTNAWTFAGSSGITIYGDFTVPSVTTITNTANYNFQGQGLTQTLTTNGVSFSGGINQTSVGGTLVLNGAVTCASTATVTLNNGTLDLNNNTLTCGLFSSNNANIRSILFVNAAIVLTGLNSTVHNTSNSTNLTLTGGKSILVTGAGLAGQTRTISPGATSSGGTLANAFSFVIASGVDAIDLGTVSRVYNSIQFNSGFTGNIAANAFPQIYGNLSLSSGMTVTGGTNAWVFKATSGTFRITTSSVTINNPITFDGVGGVWEFVDALTMGSTQAMTLINGTVKLAAGTTNTVGSFVTTGISPKFLLSATPGTPATISDASGTNTVTYLTIQDSIATGGATWNALAITNMDAGGNTGWLFSTTPSIGNQITMRLRSFTQPRRF